MPKFAIERELPGAGNLHAADLKSISRKSCAVLRSLGPQIQWLNSYVADYIAPNAEMVCRHASQGGFPANRISQVRAAIDPATAE